MKKVGGRVIRERVQKMKATGMGTKRNKDRMLEPTFQMIKDIQTIKESEEVRRVG